MSGKGVGGTGAEGRRARSGGAAGPGGGGRAAALLPLLAVTVFVAACAPRAGRGVAERAEPVPYADTLPVEEPPRREFHEVGPLMKEAVRDEVGRGLSVKRAVSGFGEALNVTALDGVVPSAWFEPRIGRREMSPEEVAAGPPGAAPDTRGTLTVVGGKVGGVTPGFTVRDRKGDTYLIKLDPGGHLGLGSGADVVSSRIFWAAGYHVPKDVVVEFDPDDLVVGEESTVTAGPDDERPMRREDVLDILAWTDSLPDGRYRALASRFVDGIPKGPFRFRGTRDDDPNDYYPHQHRRELRGLWVLAAWTGHVDLRVTNTLDVWVEPPGYLRHYLVDFAATLGSRSLRVAQPRDGREYGFDLWPSLTRLLTLGAYRVGWEDEEGEPIHPSLGWIATESFEPGEWKPFWPNDAYRNMTARDAHWGAKLVGSFERAHLEAVVAEARYPDPAAADALVDILVRRRRKVLEHWYGRVTPVESLEVDVAAPEPAPLVADGERAGGSGPLSSGSPARSGVPDADARGVSAADSLRIRFDDLGLEEGLWTAAETRYRWRLETPDGPDREGETGARSGGRQTLSVPLPPDAPRAAGPGGPPTSFRLEIAARRPGASGRPAVATILRQGTGYRVVSLRH